MAAVVGAVLLGNIVGSAVAPADVESDTTGANFGTLNVHLSATGQQGGYIVCKASASVLATLADGPCSVTISQGAGTVTQTVTQ